MMDPAALRKFCSGLLEGNRNHLWRPTLCNLVLRDRISIAGSLFQFRKCLPGKVPDQGEFIARATSSPSPVSEGFMRFIFHEINRMFPVGWDRRYLGSVLRTTPSVSSCLENPRSRGGARWIESLDGEQSRRLFCDSLLGRSPLRISSRARLMSVLTEGKTRLVTVYSRDRLALKPFHDILYDRLSTEPWLLRGEAKPSCFDSFLKKRGEVFVSGDYESATDNLNLDVCEHVLGCVLRRCARVPLSVRDAIAGSLRSVVDSSSGEFVQSNGIFMGSLLSFPLLSLVNYLVFRFAVPREGVPVRINGDDIVFRARPSEVSRWESGVREGGLVLSRGKTMKSDAAFSLNSTFFTVQGGTVRLSPVVRPVRVYRRVSKPSGVTDRLREAVHGFHGHAKSVLWLWSVGWLVRPIISLQRSVWRDLGISVPKSLLRQSGLWRRERFHLSLPRPPRVPSSSSGYRQHVVPPGWRRVFRHEEADPSVQLEFRKLLVSRSWTEPLSFHSSGDVWDEARVGTFSARSWLSTWDAVLKGQHRVSGALHRSRVGVLDRREFPFGTRPVRERGSPRWEKTVPETAVSAEDDVVGLYVERIRPAPRVCYAPIAFRSGGFL